MKATTPAARGKYYGGKNGDGVYQRIINLIPPHKVLIELFAGSAAIARMLKPAEKTFLVEIDPVQSERLRLELNDRAVVYNTSYTDLQVQLQINRETFLFCDPPYLKDVRTYKRDIYHTEWSYEDHTELIKWLHCSEAMVMITHPRCLLYEASLPGWYSVDYEYMSRRGKRSDCIWMNYATPDLLHDYSYIGDNRTERQEISRKIERWMERMSKLPPIQRRAIIAKSEERFY